MLVKVKFKHNERGQVTESLTTAVLGLVFISKVTYEYDQQGRLVSEITWKDNKTVASVKHVEAHELPPALPKKPARKNRTAKPQLEPVG